MNVALLAPEFIPNWGGVGTYCIELARALSPHVDLHVVTLEREVDGHPATSAEDLNEYFEGRLCIHVVSRATNTFLYNARFQMAVSRILPKLREEEGLELIHSHHAHMSHVLYGLNESRLPIITTAHTTVGGQRRGTRIAGMPFAQLESSEKWQLVLQSGLRIAENVSLAESDRFITMSRWMLGQLRDRRPPVDAPVDIIPSGVDPRRFAPERRSECKTLESVEEPIVLFTSRLTAAKGIYVAIDTMKRVLSQRRDVHFVFAGGGSPQFWPPYMEAHGIPTDAFTFLGYVPFESLPPLYARAAMFLLPTFYENLPLRMLEAMSSGTPVIASRVCGIPEVIEHMRNGLLVPLNDAESLASSILLLLDDPRLSTDLGRSARETVLREFDWKVVAERTRASYDRLLEQHS